MFKSKHMFLLMVVVMLMAAIQAQECSGKNEAFTTCGTACPPKCKEELKPCTLQCVIGCQCKPGYVLNDKEECVTPAEC